MPEFSVLMQKLTTEFVWIDVEAVDQEEADRAAVEIADLGFFEYEEDVEVEEGAWEVDKSFCCLDCGVDTSGIGEYPLMIRNELWYQIVPGGKGMLCKADMERRLGRPLTEEDLLPVGHGKPEDEDDERERGDDAGEGEDNQASHLEPLDQQPRAAEAPVLPS